jgi:cytochrome c oxidase subunit II
VTPGSPRRRCRPCRRPATGATAAVRAGRTARAAAVIGAGAAGLLAGCGRGSPSALDPAGASARHVASLWWLLLAMGGTVYVIVAGLIVGAWRRRGTGLDVNRFVAIGGVAVPAVILTVVGVQTVRVTGQVFADQGRPADIVVEGEQWWWRVSYPGTGVVTANAIHIPTNRPMTVELRSDDVIHSFWVPQIAPKVDMIPGQTNEIVLNARKPGTYNGQCAEFCGLQHAHMRFVVVAQSPADYQAWLAARRRAPALPPPGSEAATGAAVFLDQACSGCHRIRGTQATAKVGPDLTDMGSRAMLGAGTAPNDPATLARWIRDAPALKPGVKMPPIQLSARDTRALVAYLDSLNPDRNRP